MPQTLSDLFRAALVTEDDIDAAVAAFMADPTITSWRFNEGYTMDLGAAVWASGFASAMLRREDVGFKSKRSAVKSALLMARAVEG